MFREDSIFFLNFKEDISLFTKLFSGYLNPKLKLQKNIFFFKKNIPKPSDNWIQIIRFKEEYGGKYENNCTIIKKKLFPETICSKF